jgi:uncharacterized membrane protein YphA (DoxX/SURF4 family)
VKSSLNHAIDWVLRLIPALIIGRAALMKLNGDPGVVSIFSALHMEPGGRILIGVIELLAVALLLSSRLSGWGALLGLGVMCGAVIAHATVIGFGDTLTMLFGMAVVSSVACTILLFRLRHQLPFVKTMFDS